MEHLKQTPNRNVFLGAHHVGDEIVVGAGEDEEDRIGRRGRVEEVFGEYAAWVSTYALLIRAGTGVVKNDVAK